MQLSVDITANCDGRFDWGGIGFFRKDGSCLLGDELSLLLSNTFEVAQAIDNDIHIVFIAHLNIIIC